MSPAPIQGALRAGSMHHTIGEDRRLPFNAASPLFSYLFADASNNDPLMTPGRRHLHQIAPGRQSPDSGSSRPSPILADPAPPSAESDRQFVIAPRKQAILGRKTPPGCPFPVQPRLEGIQRSPRRFKRNAPYGALHGPANLYRVPCPGRVAMTVAPPDSKALNSAHTGM